jgi:hypothetical protein
MVFGTVEKTVWGISFPWYNVSGEFLVQDPGMYQIHSWILYQLCDFFWSPAMPGPGRAMSRESYIGPLSQLLDHFSNIKPHSRLQTELLTCWGPYLIPRRRRIKMENMSLTLGVSNYFQILFNCFLADSNWFGIIPTLLLNGEDPVLTLSTLTFLTPPQNLRSFYIPFFLTLLRAFLCPFRILCETFFGPSPAAERALMTCPGDNRQKLIWYIPD